MGSKEEGRLFSSSSYSSSTSPLSRREDAGREGEGEGQGVRARGRKEGEMPTKARTTIGDIIGLEDREGETRERGREKGESVSFSSSSSALAAAAAGSAASTESAKGPAASPESTNRFKNEPSRLDVLKRLHANDSKTWTYVASCL